MVANGFHAPVCPDDRSVSAIRGAARRAHGASARSASDDLRDLQVWHKLAWMDPDLLVARCAARRPRRTRIAASAKPTRRCCDSVELELLARVVPAYREASARGQVELATSPFYHPILPLLCDSDAHQRAQPGAPKPRQRFTRPDDARAADRARDRVSRGDVRQPAVGHVAVGGVGVGRGGRADGRGRPEVDRHRRGHPVAFAEDADARRSCCTGRIAIGDARPGRVVPRSRAVGSHRLSLPVVGCGRGRGRLRRARPRRGPSIRGRRRRGSRHRSGHPRRRERLGVLRRRRPAVPARALPALSACRRTSRRSRWPKRPRARRRTLPSIFPGSWINGDFYIWIGHRDDHRAWDQLSDARAMFDQRADAVAPEARDRALEELLIAEGSDWFWWYGDDHSSDHDADFDDLFRRHLRNAYAALGVPIPEELFATNISTGAGPRPARSRPAVLTVDPRRQGHELPGVGGRGRSGAGASRRRDA